MCNDDYDDDDASICEIKIWKSDIFTMRVKFCVYSYNNNITKWISDEHACTPDDQR